MLLAPFANIYGNFTGPINQYTDLRALCRPILIEAIIILARKSIEKKDCSSNFQVNKNASAILQLLQFGNLFLRITNQNLIPRFQKRGSRYKLTFFSRFRQMVWSILACLNKLLANLDKLRQGFFTYLTHCFLHGVGNRCNPMEPTHQRLGHKSAERGHRNKNYSPQNNFGTTQQNFIA
jgi:hypothetical protein